MRKIDLFANMDFKLEVGCGPSPRKGYTGMDILDFGQAIVWDVDQGIPLPDNSCVEIFCQHTLEHVKDLMGVMDEFWRVLRPGGKLTAIVPHKDNPKALVPTHLRLMDEGTFRAFEEAESRPHYTSKRWKINDLAVNDRPDVVVEMTPVKTQFDEFKEGDLR
jgi:ubiquinone/menaquinone biosynthesis C-methylase UbiE